MVTKYAIVVFVMAQFLSCVSITEHEMTISAGLNVFSGSDLSPLFPGDRISGGRSLIVTPGTVFVTTTEGKLLRYDADTMTLTDDYLIDSPSAAGFYYMVHKTHGNSLYIIGAMGKILEVEVSDCTVKDSFKPGQSAVSLAMSHGITQYLYVVDGPSNHVMQVSISTHRVLSQLPFNGTVNCIEGVTGDDSILVGTSEAVFVVSPSGPGTLSTVKCIENVGGCQQLDAIPGSENYVALFGRRTVCRIVRTEIEPGEPWFAILESAELEGEVHMIAAGADYCSIYILSYIGDMRSRLYTFNYSTLVLSEGIVIEGYPLGLEVSGSNNVFTLTAVE